MDGKRPQPVINYKNILNPAGVEMFHHK